MDFEAPQLGGPGSIFAGLVLVFGEVFFLVLLQGLCLIADTLCSFDGGFAGKFVVWVGWGLVENRFPLVAFRYQIFECLADVGVLTVVGVQIVLQFIDKARELLDFCTQFSGAILGSLVG